MQWDNLFATERNEFLIHAATQINLKALCKGKKLDTKSTYCMIPFMCHSGKGKTIITENTLVVSRDWEQREGTD